MKKKNFTTGFDSLLGSATETKSNVKKEEISQNEIRTTITVDASLMKKIKSIAIWSQSPMKDIISKSIEQYIKKYEKEHGEISIPEKN